MRKTGGKRESFADDTLRSHRKKIDQKAEEERKKRLQKELAKQSKPAPKVKRKKQDKRKRKLQQARPRAGAGGSY